MRAHGRRAGPSAGSVGAPRQWVLRHLGGSIPEAACKVQDGLLLLHTALLLLDLLPTLLPQTTEW